MPRPMFDSNDGGIQINGGTFSDVARDQYNTYNNNDTFDFQAGSNPHMHHYRPGTRVNHGPVTNISHAGNLNLGTNYGRLIQNSGGSYSSPPPPEPYYPPYPPMGYDGDPGYWGYPPYGMPHPWAQAPYSQPPTPPYGYYPGDDESDSYTRHYPNRNPYRQRAPANPRSPAKRQETNPFRMNLSRTESAPLNQGTHKEPYRPRSDQRQRQAPLDGVDESMANLHLDNDRRDGGSSNGQSPPRGQPRRTRCETVVDEDEPSFRSRPSDFGLGR